MTKVQKLINYVKELAGICDELNVYEWEDGDKLVQEARQYVRKIEKEDEK